MNLKCLVDHQYQEQKFVAGKVYELDDVLAMDLLRDFGPGEVTGVGSVETRRGRPAKFEPTTERPTEPDKPPPEGGEENVIDNTLPPEGEGAPEADTASAEDEDDEPDLESMTRAQLEAFAQQRDLEAPKSGTVAELRDFLRQQLADGYEAPPEKTQADAP